MFNKSKIIIFAAGGGNDVFSALAYVKSWLCDYNFDEIALVSILGLTPFHSNKEIIPNIINVEMPLIKPTSAMHRYLMLPNPKEIYCMEKLLPELINDYAPHIKNYICISSKYSALEQTKNLLTLFNEWNMKSFDTLLNIVDFGGDILTNGLQSSIISPELDAFTLAVVQNLCNDYNYSSKICICFPGVDGELSNEYLKKWLNKSTKFSIDKNNWLNTLNKIHDKIRDKRIGNTIPNMIKILKTINDSNNTDNTCDCDLNKKWKIGKEHYVHNKKLTLDLSLQNYVYMFDKIMHNPFVNIFNNIKYDFIEIIKSILDIYSMQNIDANVFQSSDFHLQFLCQDYDGLWTNKHLYYNNNNEITQKIMIVNIIPTIMINYEYEMITEINNLISINKILLFK